MSRDPLKNFKAAMGPQEREAFDQSIKDLVDETAAHDHDGEPLCRRICEACRKAQKHPYMDKQHRSWGPCDSCGATNLCHVYPSHAATAKAVSP